MLLLADRFFPTDHIHDETVHRKERFDHTQYCQVDCNVPETFAESPWLAGSVVKVGKAQGIVKGDARV